MEGKADVSLRTRENTEQIERVQDPRRAPPKKRWNIKFVSAYLTLSSRCREGGKKGGKRKKGLVRTAAFELRWRRFLRQITHDTFRSFRAFIQR